MTSPLVKSSKRILALVCLLAAFLVSASTSAARDYAFSGVDRVVAVGDLHGDYEQYIKILQANGLINKKLKWNGGETHLVQLGDVTDRGPDSLKIIRHMMKLEKQARRAGGKVHVLVGNHEAMNVQTDLRYVHPGEYSALVTKRSKKNQQLYLDLVYQSMLANQPELAAQEQETKSRLASRFPLGYVEHRKLWEPGNELARWYADNNTVVKIDRTLYLHGGIDPHVESYSPLADINKAIASELSANGTGALTTNPRGPLWYRGLAKNDAQTELAPLDQMLKYYDVDRIVVAHSTTHGAVMPRFNRKVVVTDVGISDHYGGNLANLIIEGGQNMTVMHRGELLELPNDEGLMSYLETAAQLEPKGSRLIRYVDLLKQPASDESQSPYKQAVSEQSPAQEVKSEEVTN